MPTVIWPVIQINNSVWHPSMSGNKESQQCALNKNGHRTTWPTMRSSKCNINRRKMRDSLSHKILVKCLISKSISTAKLKEEYLMGFRDRRSLTSIALKMYRAKLLSHIKFSPQWTYKDAIARMVHSLSKSI